ncbi:MAG: site-specific integrase [Candidatus Levybacteria bacterium]|nr:site-specific integrase [Candidatus Levybacteria bacterium]
MTDLIQAFITHLKNLPQPASSATVKNYVADIRQFVYWFEQQNQRSFLPQLVTPQIFDQYIAYRRDQDGLSLPSIKRHKASIRKFFVFLQDTGTIEHSLIAQEAKISKTSTDLWHLRSFKDYLYENRLKRNTITNYIADIQQFLEWLEAVTGAQDAFLVSEKDPLQKISSFIVEEYKTRLLGAGISPASVNRKLSSIRKYTAWLYQQGIIGKYVTFSDVVVASPPNLSPLPSGGPTHEINTLPALPPVRLVQKAVQAADSVFEWLIVAPAARVVDQAIYALWYLKGKPIATTPKSTLRPPLYDFTIGNIKKSLYAPHAISIKDAPLHKKLFFHIHQSRPKWYKKYHEYAVVHYFHFAILIISMAIIGVSLGKILFPTPKQVVMANAEPVSPPRVLSFQGRLTDPSDNPITQTKSIRFRLYNSQTASGSAMLWEEMQDIKPDLNGIFAVQLGKKTAIDQAVFGNNDSVYLGIAVGSDEELRPRHQLATVAYATNAELLQGLLPITQAGAGSKNVVLALDSTGNLSIGGSANPIFQATGGEFKLSGKSLVLATNVGSNGNVSLSPDGKGFIDALAPIQNSSNNNNLAAVPGAVEIDDILAIYATSSAHSALVVEQSGTGPIISASTSGTAKFTLGNDGSGYFAGKLGIGVSSASAKLTVDGASIGKALAILNESGDQNILVGSASGTLKFYFDRSGNLTTANGSLWKPTSDSTTGLRIGNSSGTSFVTFDTSNSRVGIGTTPNFKLDVTDSQSATVSAMITNSSTDTDADVLALKLGITTDPAVTNRFLTFLNGNGTIVGKVQGNGASGVSYATAGVDFAEYFKKQDQTEIFSPYDLVCLGNSGVTKCAGKTQVIVGVISNQAGFIGGVDHEGDPKFVLVGLNGQLRVRVKSETINVGDPLTTSLIQSVAEKATTAGQIVGYAIESFDPTKDSKDTILISVSPSWYDPNVFLTHTGDLNVVKDQSKVAKPSYFSVQTTLGQLVTKVGAFSKAVIGVLEVGALKASEISAQEIISPIASIDRVRTDVISPLSSEQLTIRLASSSLSAVEIQNASGAAVARIDQEGNASFSGQLLSKELTVQNNASISGVLYAQKIIADEVEFPVVATKANLAQDFETPVESATASATLGETIEANFATFTQGLIAFGPSSFGTTAINGQLSVGSPTGGLILADNAINVLGASLELQPLRQGDVSFLGGLVQIDIEGNLRVDGNATFGKDVTVKGEIFANVIAPIPDKDLVIKLEGSRSATCATSTTGNDACDTNDTSDTRGTQFIVQDASGSGVFSLDQQGNLTASGSANVASLLTQTLQIARNAQADTSLTETTATSSAGTATILPGEKERTVYTPFVKESSLIYISPTSNTYGKNPYIARQTPSDSEHGILGSFTVAVEERLSKPISLNWWVVN